MQGILFDEQIAPYYESWFATEEGQRADRLEKALLGRLRQRLEPPGTVLEVGCGTGHFSRWLSGWADQVVGLDHSAAMLAEARARGGGPYLLGDALALPFADKAFDLVALITVLEFISRPTAALAEAWRVARRGLLLGVLNRVSPIAWVRRIQGLFSPTLYDGARFYSPEELSELAQRSAGRPVGVSWATTLWPRWLPLEGSALPWGAFIGLAAWVDPPGPAEA